MLKDRIAHYRQLEQLRGSKLLVYVTGDRKGLELNIAPDILPFVGRHLEAMGDVPRISLLLHTRGGITLAAWSLVNLIRSYCQEMEVIVPFRALSAGTLICLGAERIVMTRQAALGPIDPSTNGYMNPQVDINGKRVKVPLSVEQVSAYLDMARNDLGIHDQEHLKDILIQLAEKVHPLSLGDVYRSRAQIQMLAKRLLRNQRIDPEKEARAINFLTSESGSHDYTIHRQEAAEELGLHVERPDDVQEALVRAIYRDISTELELDEPYDPRFVLAQAAPVKYVHRRGLIESLAGGTDVFLSTGVLARPATAAPQGPPFMDQRTFEGWRHEPIVG